MERGVALLTRDAAPATTSRSPATQLERDESGAEAPIDGPTTVIWGTDINAAVVERKISRFLTAYSPLDEALPTDEELPGAPAGKYARLLRQVVENGEPMLNIDCQDILASGDRLLYEWLVRYPREVIPLFDAEVAKLVAAERAAELAAAGELAGEDAELPVVQVRAV